MIRRWLTGVAVVVGALSLCVGAVAASKTYYRSGRRGKAPYISVTVSRGQVRTVNWWMNEQDCPPGHGPTHLNTRIKRNGRFNETITYSIPGWLGGWSGGTHIWGRLSGSTATVTIDDWSSGQSVSICEGKHTFHAVRA